MKRNQHHENIAGLRPPGEKEAANIEAYFTYNCGKEYRKSRLWQCIWLLLGIGLLFVTIFGYIYDDSVASSVFWLIIFFGFGAVLMSDLFRRDKIKQNQALQRIRARQYKVVDGTISSFEGAGSGIIYAKFYSSVGQLVEDQFSIRCEQTGVGEPALLMYMEPGIHRKEELRLFTPYMFTKKGMKAALHYAPDYLPL